MAKLAETTFGNVVLGARVWVNGRIGQKIDDPIGGKNKYGQAQNFYSQPMSNIKADTVVKTTIYSQKDKPELRHV